LSYQAQLNSERHIFSAEVLLHWRHPEHGTLLPAQFIAVAEETGLILGIGLWVLRAACEQLKQWQANPATCKLILALNVSAKQFRHSDFASQALSIL